jgi:hypothetical protein
VAAIWVAAFVLGVWTVQRSGAPLLDVVRYAAYFGGCVTLPGVLLLRACTISRRTPAEDVGVGTAVGLAYELAGWAMWTALGLPRMLIVWALAVPVTFLLVPRLRRFWRAPEAPRLSLWWSAGLASVISAAIVFWYGSAIQPITIPPNGASYYPDLLWHLSLVQEAGRHVPPQIPQVAGETLHYHWFADAHLASAAHISGVDPRLIVFRLWFAPLLVATALCIAALARQVSRAWWTGPIAVVVTVITCRVALWQYVGFGPMPVVFLSPTQTYGSLLCVAAAILLLAVLFGRQPRRAWIAVALLLCASAGSKPTTIPLLLAGTGLAALFLLIRSGRLPKATLLTCVGLLVLGFVAASTVTGSTSGTGIRLFGFLRLFPGYRVVTGDTTYPVPRGSLIVAGLRNADAHVIVWAMLMLLVALVTMAMCVVPLLAVVVPRTRTDPVHWWLLGAVIGGWLGYVLVDHPGGAENYFLGSAVPFGVVLTTSVAAAGLHGRSRRTRRTVVIATLAPAVMVLGVIRLFGNVGPAPHGRYAIIWLVAEPLLWFAVITLLAVIGWTVLRITRPAVRGLGVTVVAVAALGLVLPGRPPHAVLDALAMDTPSPQRNQARPAFTAAENQAADWVEHNVPADDVVATNTLCKLPRAPGQCDARGYLVSGIGGRRTFIEGWAYTEQSMKNQQPDVHYTMLSSPWPDRVEVTERAIVGPSAATMQALKTAGVRWLLVDQRFGVPDTEGLRRYADQRFDNGGVQIYQLR